VTGRTPSQARVSALLQDVASGLTVTVSDRSPVGARALRIHQAPPEVLRWLADQPWVAAVASRPPHAYVSVTTEALRYWVASGLCRPTAGPSPAGLVSATTDPTTPTQFREAAVGRSVAALLATTSPTTSPAPGTAGIRTFVVGGGPIPRDTPAVHLPVGPVDIPFGPLPTRHGGSVTAADLLDEAGRRADDADPAVLLAFVMVRTERSRRLPLDDGKLDREAAAFHALRAARDLAQARGGPAGVTAAAVPASPAADRAVRALAQELDALPELVSRAAKALEPALILRYAGTLATRVSAARTHLPNDDPLWPVAARAVRHAYTLAGLDSHHPSAEGLRR
jgi:hypothetical protein